MIYIDITDTIKALHITGIQRVVANIIKYSFKLDNVAFVEYDSALQVYIVIDKSDNRIFSLNICENRNVGLGGHPPKSARKTPQAGS